MGPGGCGKKATLGTSIEEGARLRQPYLIDSVDQTVRLKAAVEVYADFGQ